MCITYLSRDSCRNLICKNLGRDMRFLWGRVGPGRVGSGRAANTQIFPLNTKELAPLAALARS